MRTIDRSTRFKRDYKRESKGRHRATLDADLQPILAALATDTLLDPKYRDHDLSGDWAGYRDCHIKPDLVLIYAKPDDETLHLARRECPASQATSKVAILSTYGKGVLILSQKSLSDAHTLG